MNRFTINWNGNKPEDYEDAALALCEALDSVEQALRHTAELCLERNYITREFPREDYEKDHRELREAFAALKSLEDFCTNLLRRINFETARLAPVTDDPCDNMMPPKG